MIGDREMKRKRFNVYGYWQYGDWFEKSCGVKRDDVVYVYSKCKDMVKAYTTGGRKISFHVINLTHGYFVRLDRGSHVIANCLAKGMYGRDCRKCSVTRAKLAFKKVMKTRKIRG